VEVGLKVPGADRARMRTEQPALQERDRRVAGPASRRSRAAPLGDPLRRAPPPGGPGEAHAAIGIRRQYKWKHWRTKWRQIKATERGCDIDFECATTANNATPRARSNPLREFFDGRKEGPGNLEVEPLFRYL